MCVTYPPAHVQTADTFKTVQDLVNLGQYFNRFQSSFHYFSITFAGLYSHKK